MASVGNMYVPEVKKFTNSHEFSYLATFFNEHECYTNILEGTYEYRVFWSDVRDKCLLGFTNSDGIRITGAHFFYLNFCRMDALDPKIGKKTEMFPSFMDLDYDYFHMIEYCEKNQKCLLAVKGRRQGWSYKAAAICAWEFTFFPSSSSIIGAFLSSFALTTMQMAIDNLNWINVNTEFRKQRNPDLKDHVVARYQADIGGVKVWKGYKSKIRSISFKDNPTAAVGKSAGKLILDEGGVFPNITQTYSYTEPLIKAGSSYSGVAIVFGSSGDMDSGSKYFYEMFTTPGKYNMLEFPDPENPAKSVAYFSTAVRGREGVCKNPHSEWYNQPMIDADGNSNEEAAMDDIMFLREKSKGGLDPKALHGTITQFPLTWREAFLRNKGAIFASPEMLEHLADVETTPSLRDSGETGLLVWKDDKLEFQPNPDLVQITSFPIKADEDNNGCITIWERPEYVGGQIPYSLYVGGCDPYDMDKSGSGSLGSFFMYKRFLHQGSTHDIIVAEYTGRPKSAEDFYENCRRLCIYYNAKVLYENQLKGMKNYFLQKNSLHMMWEQPDHMIKDIIKDSKVQRGYGCHMNRGSGGSSGIKDMCELYLRSWLYQERDSIDGKIIFNFHTIKSIALLKELISYDVENNFDRAIALMLCVLQTKELHKIHVDNMTNKSNTFMTDPYLQRLWNKRVIANSAFKNLKSN
jgi:hypothetical protein